MLSSGIPEFSIVGSRLSSKMETYCSAFILPSTSARIPTPFQPMHPQTIKEPPPNFTVPCTSLSCMAFPATFHTYFLPSDPILLILVSSDQITLVQSSTVHCWCLRAKASLCCLCLTDKSGFFFLTTA